MKKIFLFLSISLSLNVFAQSETRFDKIDSLLNYLTSNNKFMGSVAIRNNDEIIFEKTYGYADVKNKTQADNQTRYKIGSITKTFTSVVILQLIEEKKLTLDTKLSRFFPTIQNSEHITIDNLLSHSSGIYSFTNDLDYPTYAKLPKTRSELMKKIKAGKPVFEPGEKAEYSNSNYVILGWIIEDLTKKSYADNINTRIIQKLGLKNTGFATGAKNEALSYEWDGKNWKDASKEDMSIPGGAGAILSSASDLTAFINALFSGKLLKQPSLDTMITIEQGYGKGIFAMPFAERRFYGHSGGIESFTSSLIHYPKEKLSIALLDNGQGYDTDGIMIGILSIYYKMPYRFPNLKTATVDVAILKKYVGIYSDPNFPLKISIKEENGVLICQATGQESFPLNPLSDTKFNFDPAGLELVFSPNAMTILQGGHEFKLTKEK
ncbi:MAG: beta-lactamase family protein [Flavobacterium lindanitolerans]|uniref:serine hydrolase domain-containing protein n=1 Tax=Flavobacterium lindanitolerans TaxID=428988 RepID=UPI001A55CE92|nr:serine hydrolase domain-containing protein [Flavobacterium lindanitolerans]MBL7866942.1 beta-lactamase family protein [Flavobacterium lindanitolerans]